MNKHDLMMIALGAVLGIVLAPQVKRLPLVSKIPQV